MKRKSEKRKCRGSSIVSTPIIIAIGIMITSMLIVMAVKILMPYIWYEKLSSTCIKYVFIMEEFGYLTKNEANQMKAELVNQGFKGDKVTLDYTKSRVDYGNPIFLKLSYEYDLELPFLSKEKIPMVIERNSVSKR